VEIKQDRKVKAHRQEDRLDIVMKMTNPDTTNPYMGVPDLDAEILGTGDLAVVDAGRSVCAVRIQMKRIRCCRK